MIIKTVQDALDWFNLNKQGYKEDYIAIIKLQALINRTEEPRAIENKDILELQKTINQMSKGEKNMIFLRVDLDCNYEHAKEIQKDLNEQFFHDTDVEVQVKAFEKESMSGHKYYQYALVFTKPEDDD